MKRRQLISQIAVGATSASIAACSSETTRFSQTKVQQVDQPLIEWRMATSWPKTFQETVYGGVEVLCSRISKLTGGRFTITPTPAGEIVPDLEVLDAVQQRKVECGHTAGYYYIDKNPALAFSSAMPFGLNTKQQNAWLLAGDGLELTRKVYADFNVLNFPAGSTGNQMGGWFKQEVKSLSDLKALKMRLTGLGGEVIKRLGAEDVQNLPAADILPALERGDINAAEWIGPYDDEKLGLNKSASFYYYPGWQDPGVTFDLIVNRSAWEQLPKGYQVAIQAAASEAYATIISRYENLNPGALQRLVSSGTKLVPFTKEILAAAQKAAFELYEEKASTDATFKEVYTQWKGFREQIYQWHRVDELSFADFVFA